MAFQIKKAVKFGSKLRLALYGPSGSGKTYSAISIAREMQGDKRICVIDTEYKSASKYADIFDFDVIELDSFHPQTYIDAIKTVTQAKEHSILILDSISHEWEGSKGALELAGQNFINWAKVTPLHNAFTDAILSTPLHIIATMRAKEKHEVYTDKNGKPGVRKLGMEPIQGKGIQYEFDIVGSMDMENVLTVEKTRCSLLTGGVFPLPGKEIADILLPWLDGEPAPATEEQLNSIRKAYKVLGKGDPNMTDLNYETAKQKIAELTAEYREKQQSKQSA